MESSTNQEAVLWRRGYRAVAGVDEAGRGPLAGPVVAAAVVIVPGTQLPPFKDSKHLSPLKREKLFSLFKKHPAVFFATGRVSNKVIDRMNIHRATLLAMARAVNNLAKRSPAEYLLVDGAFLIPSNIPQRAVIHGDELIRACAAASIVAKVVRDRLMAKYHRQNPEYEFSAHKGYGTRAHVAALKKHGPCPLHRMSFQPCKALSVVLP